VFIKICENCAPAAGGNDVNFAAVLAQRLVRCSFNSDHAALGLLKVVS